MIRLLGSDSGDAVQDCPTEQTLRMRMRLFFGFDNAAYRAITPLLTEGSWLRDTRPLGHLGVTSSTVVGTT
jgi:hypothetical protein